MENFQSGWLEFDPGTLNLPISNAANTSRLSLHHNSGFRSLEGRSSQVSHVFWVRLGRPFRKSYCVEFWLLFAFEIVQYITIESPYHLLWRKNYTHFPTEFILEIRVIIRLKRIVFLVLL